MKAVNIQFLNELTSKTELADLLGVSRKSIHNYHRIAFDCVCDYQDDFPKVLDKEITRHPLTKYQCWVLTKIAWHLRLFSMDELAYFLVEDYQFSCQFTKEKFNFLYTNSENGDSNHGNQSLLRIA